MPPELFILYQDNNMNPYLRNFLFFAGGFVTAYLIGVLLVFNAIRKEAIKQNNDLTSPGEPGTPPQ